MIHHLLHWVCHLSSIVALNWLWSCFVGSCWREGHRWLLNRHSRSRSDLISRLEWICRGVHGRLLIHPVSSRGHERTSRRVHLSWCRRWLKYLSLCHQVGLLLSRRLQISRSCLWRSASYDKYIRGLLLNEVLEEGICHFFEGLLVDISMECLKLAFLGFGLNITAGFHLPEHTTILVRYRSFVLSICCTVLFLFLAFLIAAMFLHLSTIFLYVAIRRSCALDLLLYALCSFLFTFWNWGHV